MKAREHEESDARAREATVSAQEHPAFDPQRLAGNAAAAELYEPDLSVLSSGSGRPLDEDVRADMESRFGADFSDVRIHTGLQANLSAQSVDAHAYTVGSNIVFSDGAYNHASDDGRHTLAHELTHVLQQRSGPVDGTAIARGDVSISDPDDRHEREAETHASQVMRQATSAEAQTGAQSHLPARAEACVQREEAKGHLLDYARDTYEHAKRLFNKEPDKDTDADWTKSSEEAVLHTRMALDLAGAAFDHLADEAMKADNTGALRLAREAGEHVAKASELFNTAAETFEHTTKFAKILVQLNEMRDAAAQLRDCDLGNPGDQRKGAAALDTLAGGFGEIGKSLASGSPAQGYFGLLAQFKSASFFAHWADFVHNYTDRALRAADHD